MAENNTLVYKGHPLVRHGNELYYGAPDDSHVVFIQILENNTVNGEQVASKVHMMLLSNDPALSPVERIQKQGDRNGLYEALDIASIWLDRATSEGSAE